eukprot:1551871-Prymnesium_polylepis.1
MVVRAVTDVTGLAAGGTTTVRAGAVSPHVLKGSGVAFSMLIEAAANCGRAVEIMDLDATPTGPPP